MCTVSFLPLNDDNFILTSNRDETPLRATISPKYYTENGVTLWYPKDALAGGTWIGTSNQKRVVCLLNGAFEKHQRKAFYEKSRGIIVKQLLVTKDAILDIDQTNFTDFEPFTLILIDFNTNLKIFELVWDGQKKYLKQLENKPAIWSSSTLYNEDMKLERESWFKDWLTKNAHFTREKILAFHQDSSKGTKETALKMKRTFVETVSVTSIEKKEALIMMRYFDFLKDEVTETQMKIEA